MTQKEFRKNFWSYLKEVDYVQYSKSFKSKGQNEQPTTTRVMFCDYMDNEFKDGNITEKQVNNWTL